jgi:hypothetical protein
LIPVMGIPVGPPGIGLGLRAVCGVYVNGLSTPSFIQNLTMAYRPWDPDDVNFEIRDHVSHMLGKHPHKAMSFALISEQPRFHAFLAWLACRDQAKVEPICNKYRQ